MRVSVPANTMRENLIRIVPPTVPSSQKEDATVLFRATVGRDGRVRSTHLLEGNAELAKAANDAVMQWQYKPYLVNGQPADVDTQITVNFKAADNGSAK